MPLTIQLREKTTIPVEVDSIKMEAVREQTSDGAGTLLAFDPDETVHAVCNVSGKDAILAYLAEHYGRAR